MTHSPSLRPIAGPLPSSEKVAIVFDERNIYYSCRQFLGGMPDYNVILSDALAGRTLTEKPKVVMSKIPKNEHIFQQLRREGYEVFRVSPMPLPDGSCKDRTDSYIYSLLFHLATSESDIIILVSSDGDFAPFLRTIKTKERKQVEVVGVFFSMSFDLEQVADRVIYLGKEHLL